MVTVKAALGYSLPLPLHASWDLGPRQDLFGNNSALITFNQPTYISAHNTIVSPVDSLLLCTHSCSRPVNFEQDFSPNEPVCSQQGRVYCWQFTVYWQQIKSDTFWARHVMEPALSAYTKSVSPVDSLLCIHNRSRPLNFERDFSPN